MFSTKKIWKMIVAPIQITEREIIAIQDYDFSGFRSCFLKRAEKKLAKSLRSLKRRAAQVSVNGSALMIECGDAHKIVSEAACALLVRRGQLDKWSGVAPYVYVFNY